MTSHLPLGLDATYTLDPQPTGVSVYSSEILLGLARLDPLWPIRAYYRPHRFRRAVQQPLAPNIARRVLTDWIAPAVQVFHGLNQRLPRRIRQRSVVTFHDLFVLTGEYSTPDFRSRFAEFSRDAARRADLIITVSEFTASQVSDFLNVDASRIRVVPHGVRPPPSVPTIDERQKMVLHVGALQSRKNIVRLVEAFEQMPGDWRLVLAGGLGYGAEPILTRIAGSPRSHQIEITGYVTNSNLEELYQQASILAFPSLDEGFGIPILDAMARGVAVVTSRRSATEEVAGEAALLIHPNDVGELAAALQRIADDDDLRARLVNQGFERAKKFDWDTAVRKTRAVYKELGV